MRRIDKNEILDLALCPECNNKLITKGDELICSICNNHVHFFNGAPVLIRNDNELFPVSAYKNESDKKSKNNNSKPNTLNRLLGAITPSRSINLSRERILNILAENCKPESKILVVGCGNQIPQLERIFQKCDTVFVFCDIDKNADADIFCDSHLLPFKDSCFDGVISTAVMEHVLYPEVVAAEIYKVLKLNGFIYSEIPFLQSVHEGAYDFTRFTMSGHRRLFEFFEEKDAGMIAGPGTALVWAIDELAKSLSTNNKVSRLLSSAIRILFAWIKYFDLFVKNNPVAVNAASCTYFLGTKKSNKTSAITIINSYYGPQHLHI